MQRHKFSIGQSVRSAGTTVPSVHQRSLVAIPAGSYKIVRHMPAVEGQLQYHVRSTQDGHERVVVEGDLCP